MKLIFDRLLSYPPSRGSLQSQGPLSPIHSPEKKDFHRTSTALIQVAVAGHREGEIN